MEDSVYEEEVVLAREVRDVLDEDPSMSEWVEGVSAEINSTGEIPEGTWDRLSSYFLNDLPMRNRIHAVLDQDENGVQLLCLIFTQDEQILEEDEEEDGDDEGREEIEIPEDQEVPMERILTGEKLKLNQEEQMQNIAQTLNISNDVAFFVLSYYNWNSEKAIAGYLEKPSASLSSYGIGPEQTKEVLGLKKAGHGSCEICCDDDVDLYALQCGHMFCEACWKGHIESKVLVGDSNVRCQSFKCHAMVMQKDVEKFCGPDVASSYETYVLDTQISMNTQVKRCINPHCSNLLTLDSVGPCMVAACKCGTRICWRCYETSHAPCSCENKAKWLNVADDDKIAAKWLHENTKICPKCKTRIEKNGGCNHMTCYKCHHEFCWICGHEWSTHGGGYYECNRYKPETGKGTNELITDDVDRLSHYFARYTNHKKSLEIEREKKQTFQDRLMANFMQRRRDAISFEEAKELTDEIFNTITYSRTILLWSYPHAYYMKAGSTELNLFEFVQKDVEIYLDELSDLVENAYTNPPKSFEIPYKILAKNVEVLIKHVASS